MFASGAVAAAVAAAAAAGLLLWPLLLSPVPAFCRWQVSKVPAAAVEAGGGRLLAAAVAAAVGLVQCTTFLHM